MVVKVSGHRRRLPIVKVAGKRYYRDDRLQEFRNVDNPHDVLTFDSLESYRQAEYND